MGATNLPWALDPAVRRRLEKRVYISLPEKAARVHLLKNAMKDTPHDLTVQDIESLGDKTDMYIY